MMLASAVVFRKLYLPYVFTIFLVISGLSYCILLAKRHVNVYIFVQVKAIFVLSCALNNFSTVTTHIQALKRNHLRATALVQLESKECCCLLSAGGFCSHATQVLYMSVEIKPTIDKCVPVLLFLLSSLFIIPQFYLLSASVMETKHFYLSSTF